VPGPPPPDAESAAYLRYHRHRYAVILERASRALRGVPLGSARVLDVGPMLQTALLREHFPSATIDALGFPHPTAPLREHERHLDADLDALDTAPEADGSYHLVVVAEVIEHLNTPASRVLAYLSGFLRPAGVLLVQTPNAAALHKRVRALTGRSALNAAAPDPGHVHEYTLGELVNAAGQTGLWVVDVSLANYFAHPSAAGTAWRLAGPLLPSRWRHGITLELRRRPVVSER
jgi:2-polyprenyl-3-methyl-5-hydroxy-6-metoxy-1,4-benzoquinol methylase